MVTQKGPRTCTFCRKRGHTEDYCWKKQKQDKSGALPKYENKESQNTNTGLLVKEGMDAGNASDNRSDTENDHNDYVCLLSNHSTSHPLWIIDSGATSHMSFMRDSFHTFRSIASFKVGMGDQSIVNASGRGSI